MPAYEVAQRSLPDKKQDAWLTWGSQVGNEVEYLVNSYTCLNGE